jgi:Negative regulator of beta-lactamase expression
MHKNVEKMSINYSPNFDLKKRTSSKVKYLIFHYTGMRSENAAIKRLTSKSSKVSCHYLIKKKWSNNKNLFQIYILHGMPGISSWKKDKSLNSNSIGNRDSQTQDMIINTKTFTHKQIAPIYPICSKN